MEQAVHGIEAVEHAKLLAQHFAQAGSSEGAYAILGRGAGLQALQETRQVRRRQTRLAAASGTILQNRQGLRVVLLHDPLHRAPARSQRRGDPRRGPTLSGQNQAPQPRAPPGPGLLLFQSLQLFDAVMRRDPHAKASLPVALSSQTFIPGANT